MDLRQTAVLVLTLWSLLVSGQSPTVCSLSPGWFGSLCQYKCRCLDNKCTKDGVCVNDVPCQKGWFGPACQYADLAYNRSSARETTDGDDNTCLATPTDVTVPLDNHYHVTWLRVRLSKPDFLYNLTVHFREDESLSCTNNRTVQVDNTTLDIHCDLNETVEHVILSGPGVQDLCSVYISGGRNVALRQTSSQSSTYEEHNPDTSYSYSSEKAVDGDSDHDFYRSRTCTHTDPGDYNPHINITFSVLQHVTRYVLHNRINNYRHRLHGFKLRSFGPSMTPVFNYTDRSDSFQDVYTVIPAQVTSPINLVNIAAVDQNGRILTLCELEVYGDTACQPGQYGRECEHICNCADGQSCFVSTGGCPSGCAAGYLGPDCQTGCDVGNHGRRCQSSCSQFCARDNERGQHFCDIINGTCLHGCQSGYQGPTCAEKLPSNTVVVVVAVLGGVGVLVLVMVAVRFYMRHTVSKYGSTLDLIDTDDDDVENDESNFKDVNSSTSEAAATSTQHQVKQAGSVCAAVPGSTTLQSHHENDLFPSM